MKQPTFKQWTALLQSLGIAKGEAAASFSQEAWLRQNLKEAHKNKLDLNMLLTEITWVVLDTETTGFYPQQGDKIISVACVKIKNGTNHGWYESFVNPNRSIPEHITQLTGIRDEDVLKAPTLDEVMPLLLQFLNECCVVGYHIQHDVQFINHFLSRQYRSTLPQTAFELRQITEKLYKQPFPTLDDALSFHDIRCENRHTAKGDVEAMYQLWLQLLEKLENEKIATLYDLYVWLS
ncbi:3'-5' exonuclease [Bacillus sp. HMF5848]|uniref:exonuclease domain-containing protein n=1 Tax=Bacillus sp. HMF5848 TaxID=2495421 RepID=UPI000F76B3FC|nr:exonuclease domain-containing protein [Bacillus sp. HMF5848]RSK26271.1 3'-5' exonuclease [Bacillus sp. HMF5848]